MNKRSKLMRYLIPGFLFQSVMIGGGYGTGAEIAQFFGGHGLLGGMMGLGVTLVVWAIICGLTFAFSHIYKTYDYGSMMKELLGPLAFLYDICYYLMMMIVLAVVNASAGSMIASLTGLDQWVGIIALSVGIAWLVFAGTEMIENVLSFWSYVLYAVYIIFLFFVMDKFGPAISAEWAKAEVTGAWLEGGLQYSFYNLVVVPVVLYTIRDCESAGEAAFSGILAAIIGIVPGILLLLTMACNFPVVTAAETPVTAIFEMLDVKWLYIVFEIVLFGTLIETGTGFVKAVVDRLESAAKRANKTLSPTMYNAIVLTLIGAGLIISRFGLLGLIVKGYGTACYGFLFLFAIPMVTIGTYKIMKAKKA